MDDYISRQAAISHVDDVPYIKDHPNVGLLWKAWIESLPSAQPEQQWILCSEQLPKEEERSYWVCMEDGYQKQCRWKRYKGKDCYIYAWHSTLKVIAWMPLPEPYKGGKQDG